ncbi:MAG: xcpT 11 [Phycisphaerales bacterium]|jgi:general secretion pathway protein G|nr:xcpT 11 [Phycisphaerales bacterium]MDB5299922.1 xcpT 11 [Phycisphaerales bacterium]MDB5304617.1 xcpT 11 [Phycisphaerales bacterium]
MFKLTKPRRRTGFTLIELLLVLVILAVLAAVVLPKLVGRGEDSKIKAAKAGVSNISTALHTFEVDNGHFPTTDEGLQVLITKPGNATGDWHGPYLDRIPLDPWDHPFVYRKPGSHNTDANSGFDLFSMGPDGQESGDDIGNWQN